MKAKASRFNVFALLAAGILALFVVRTLLAVHFDVPRLFDLFDTLTLAGSVVVLLKEYAKLKPGDWLLAAGLGAVTGVGMCFATLYSPYPAFGVVQGNVGQAWMRGIFTFLAALGGLAIMRLGGPVLFRTANHEPARAGRDILFGLVVGLPLAVLNVFALQYTQAQSISWQSPAAALLDALQPAVVEEVVYRCALWGLLWMILRRSMGDKAIWSSGALAMIVHNFAHYDALFVQSPLIAVGMGLVVLIFWGLPPAVLARYRSLESAIAFHWIQDAARFVAGF